MVTVQVLAAFGFEETRTAGLVIGGVTGGYSVTTKSFTADNTPDPFQFLALGNVTTGSVQTSAAVMISGIDAATPISVIGGRYKVNGGAFTDQPGTVVNGDSVVAEVQASLSAATSASASVTIGGVTAEFTVTTAAGVALDRDPVPFVALTTFNVPLGSTQISKPLPITGINTAASISVSGGRYSINGGAFTTAVGTVVEGDSVLVEVIASDQFATITGATLTVGNVSGAYQVRTRKADITPQPFAFAPMVEVLPGSLVSSAAIVIGGIDAASPVSIVGGSYSINGGPFTEAAGSIGAGDSLSVQLSASAGNAATHSATVNVGGVSAAFHVTTAGADVQPDTFSLNDHPAAFPGLATITAPVTVSGISAPVTVSVSGGLYSVNGAPFLAMPGPVANGDQLRLLLVPAPNNGDVVSGTLTVGSLSAISTATTQSPVDTFADLFEFREVAAAPRNSAVYSEPRRISNINVPVPVSITGGSYSVNGSAFTTAASTVKGGDLVQLLLLTGNVYNARHRTTITVGATRSTWTVKTGFDPAQLEPFVLKPALIYFPDGLVPPDSLNITEPVRVRNPGPPAAITVENGSYSLNGRAFTNAPATAVDGDIVVVRFRAPGSYSTGFPYVTTAVTLRIGSQQSTMPISTTLDPVAASPSQFEGCQSHVFRELSPAPLRLFVCLPPGWSSSDRRSALMEWFGGAFLTGATDRSIDQARYWANTHGMVGIAPDYRVNDRHSTYVYAPAGDAHLALKWVQDNAASLGIDPARIALSGNSSGATAATYAAVKDAPVTGDTAETPSLRAAALIGRAGTPDTTEESNANGFDPLPRFGGYHDVTSPSLNLDTAFPPTLMIHGDRDDKAAATPVVNFCSALIALGRTCQYINKTGLGHSLASPNNTPQVNEDTRVFLTGLGLLPSLPPPP